MFIVGHGLINEPLKLPRDDIQREYIEEETLQKNRF